MVNYDTKWFMRRIKEVRPKDYLDYDFEGEYVNAHIKMNVTHLKCGFQYKVIPNAFLQGRSCPKCSRIHQSKIQMKTLDDFKKEIPKTLNVLSPYKGAFVKVKVECSKCKSIYEIRPHDLLKYNKCTHCANSYHRTTNDFVKELFGITNGEYKLLGSYTTANSLVLIKHMKCGHIYKVTPHNFRQGKRCPNCVTSNGEKLIKRSLMSLGITFIPQKTFDNCKDKKLLSYDFYIPEHNILIEYQGEQHYKPVEHFGGANQFKIQQRHDRIKKEYAASKHIKLLEIPYTGNKPNDIDKLIKQSM